MSVIVIIRQFKTGVPSFFPAETYKSYLPDLTPLLNDFTESLNEVAIVKEETICFTSALFAVHLHQKLKSLRQLP
jgi:hypothetical protein